MNVLYSTEVAWHSHSEHGQGWAMIQAHVFCHQSTTGEEPLDLEVRISEIKNSSDVPI